VTTIKDYLAAGGTQTQTFGYDALERLTGATATGGSGGTYSESYVYANYTGNLSSKGGVSYAYNDTAHNHAVTHLGGVQKYWYDANGNMITRIVGADTYLLTYDVENRLTQVKKNGAIVASFVYDGDGKRVKSVVGATTTAYVGSYFEWTGSTSTMVKYYYAGATRLAMRVGANAPSYLLGDHLGSTSITADGAGNKIAEVRYLPFGGQRYANGTTPTAYRFTGQRLESSIGLYDYGARWYDPQLSRFLSADSIIPQQQGVQAWDRYAYVNNSPTTGVDTTGHWRDRPGENANPTPPAPSAHLFSTLLSIGATICDLEATAISVVGIGIEVFAAAGGEIVTPVPGVDGATGLAAGVAAYNAILNPIENRYSATSLALTTLADAVAGNHSMNQITDPISGQPATEIVLGADTTFSLGSIALGNTPLTPDALTDTAANIITLYYDVTRLRGEEPSWGLRQLRIVQPTNSSGYMEIVSP